MLLSEAIRVGLRLRGEAHPSPPAPFTRIANTDELRSDVWGAACEAVHSLVAKRNWTDATHASDIEYLREIQRKYFSTYFTAPATCPGALPRQYSEGGGRFTGRVVGGLNEVAIEGERSAAIGAITTACPSITNAAELIEHMFYVHNWTREECAQAAEHFEQGSAIKVVQNFEHYQDLSLQQRMNRKLTAVARERERQRHLRRSQRRAYFTG